MALQNSFPGPDNVTDQTEARKALAALVVRDTAGNARAGIFPRTSAGTALVTARGDMAVDIGAFEGITVRGGGPLFQANDGVAQSALLTSPPANSQYYILMFKQNESAAPYADANDNAVFPLYQGAASGAPVLATDLAAAIAAFPGAHPLAAILMPTGKTATNQVGVVITQLFDHTAVAGGEIMVRNDTELQALPAYSDGLVGAYRLDVKKSYVRRGGRWVPKYADEIVVPTVAATGGTATVNNDGSISFSGAVTAIRVNGTLAELALFKELEALISYDGSTSGTSTLQLASGSTPDATAGSYIQDALYGSGGAAGSVTPAAAAQATLSIGGRRFRRRKMIFRDLAVARFTTMRDEGAEFDAGATNYVNQIFEFVHTPTTAFDGFVINLIGMGVISNGLLELRGKN